MSKIPKIILELVGKFQRNLNEYKNPKYHETHIRVEFVNPFFKALGWDVDNEAGYAMAYRDVIHEDEVKVGGATKAPDYSFRIGGTRKFFLETKKPSVDLKHDPSPAFQLRRYAYSAKLPVSILTDFEEFIVFDCRIKPRIDDKSSVGRVMYLTFKEYVDKWEEISSIFSRESVLRGDFDRFTEGTTKKRGTAEIDKDFLEDLDRWRILLAKNIALRNQSLSQREINWAVQLTIDRLIFLRMSEDRGIENQYTLQALQNGTCVYSRLVEIFYQADDRYNSGLFHFQKKDGPYPDELTPDLNIDDKIIKEIVSELYYPKCPYEFSVLPVEVLGHAYEQFLGKVIQLTEGHRAKIEEKPEVRKAGGVYYTPKYIVDYIVENTVGKLLEGKSPNEVRDLHILDPACGSGSFLLGAFQYLMDWHLNWYFKEYEKTKKIPTVVPKKGKRKKKSDPQAIYQGHGGQWYLSTAEKKRILTNNIYGVDIDANAVEVTKLSLLLKVLENESSETINSQMKMWHERALPNLSGNIKCGNSLIGPDFYESQQSALFDEEEALRINAFDWEQEFPDIFKKGGFDAVIGNPPYGFHQIHSYNLKLYFKKKYKSAHGSFEHYFLFYEASLILLKKYGVHGFIVPVTWLQIPSAKSLRIFILQKFAVNEINWLPEQVFKDAKVNTLISIISNIDATNIGIKIFNRIPIPNNDFISRNFKQSFFMDNDYSINIFENRVETALIKRIAKYSKILGEIAKPCSGYNPYEVGKGTKPSGGPHTKQTIEEKPYHSNKKISDDWKPEIIGRNLSRYFVDFTGKRWIKYGPWLAAPRKKENFIGDRILIQEITGGVDKRIIAAYYQDELYYSRDVIPVKIIKNNYSGLFLLGIINSKLLTWYHHKRNPKAQKGLFPKILVSDIKKLPIKKIDFKNNNDVKKHDRIVMFVTQLLNFQKEFQKVKDTQIKQQLQRRIDATDQKIDQLVYELYGLTEEEIKVVENS